MILGYSHFLPLLVGQAGEDVLSMIGKLGEPKAEWVEKIPEMLKFLAARKKSILAGEIPAIPENQKRKIAASGFSLAARIILNSSKQLYEENLLSEESNNSISASYTKINELSQIASTAVNSEIDPETIKQMMDRICLLLTSSPFAKQLMLETSRISRDRVAQLSQEASN